MLDKLKELRKSKGYSVSYMADKLEISGPFYSQIEHGQRRLSYLMAVKISKIFNMKPDEIFYDGFIKEIKAD